MNTLIGNICNGSGERLLSIRKALGMTQVEFSKILNSSNGHISDMEKDRKNITESTIELLKLKCNVNENWLRHGTGEMFIKTFSNTMDHLKEEFNLDDFSYSLVYEYLKLSQEKREAVRDFFYRLIDSEENNDYLSNIPKTPKELEKKYPPVEPTRNTDAG